MFDKNKLTLLHAIRGFAAFYVVIYHAKFPLWAGGKEYLAKFPKETWGIVEYIMFGIDMLTSQGGAMVILFFVLSGFFMAYSFDKNSWKYDDFYLNRVIRIYTPFIFSLLFSLLVLYLVFLINPDLSTSNIDRGFNKSLVAGYQNLSIYTILRTLLFLPYGENTYAGFNIVYWSLLYEGIYYLIIPFIINRPKFYFLLSLVTILISAFYRSDNPLLRFFLEFSIYFAGGMIVFHLVKNSPKLIRFNFGAASIILIFLFLAIIIAGQLGYYRVSYIFAGLLGAGAILFFILYEFRDNIVLRAFKSLGVISYSMYLFHFPIFVLLYAIISDLTGQFVFYNRIYWIGVCIAVGFSYLMYELIENRSLLLISKVKSRSKLSAK